MLEEFLTNNKARIGYAFMILAIFIIVFIIINKKRKNKKKKKSNFLQKQERTDFRDGDDEIKFDIRKEVQLLEKEQQKFLSSSGRMD
jgi:flagellar biosynthesis/type III secretory pathway M-ring protein FliF/YscJ